MCKNFLQTTHGKRTHMAVYALPKILLHPWDPRLHVFLCSNGVIIIDLYMYARSRAEGPRGSDAEYCPKPLARGARSAIKVHRLIHCITRI
jgi:hypothetical protein